MVRKKARFVFAFFLVEIGSQKSKDFPFDKTSFWVTRGEMYLVKSFSGLVMSTDVKDGFVSITGSLVIVQFLSLKINNRYGPARVFS